MSLLTVTYGDREIFSGQRTPPLSVAYNEWGGDVLIPSLQDGQTKTLNCAGKVISKDIKITDANNLSTILWCGGRYTPSNITISSRTVSSVTYKRYYVSANWGSRYVTYTAKNYSSGAKGTCLYSQPPIIKNSLTSANFNFSGAEYRTIPDKNWGGQYWACNSDSLKTGSADYSPAHYGIITKYSYSFLWVTWWVDIYEIYKIDDSHICGDYIDTIQGYEGEYPDNGEKDGYWYVKQ